MTFIGYITYRGFMTVLYTYVVYLFFSKCIKLSIE